MKKLLRIAFIMCVFIAFMMGSHAWFTWPLERNGIIGLLFSGLWCGVAYFYRVYFRIRLNQNVGVVLAIVSLFMIALLSAPSIVSLIQVVLTYYPIWVLLSNTQHVEENINFINKGTAVIVLPGLLLHFLYLADVMTVSIPIAFGESTTYMFYNFFFNLESFYSEDARFRCVFLEPGYFGTLLVFLLYISKFDFKKWYNIVLLVGLIFSFSLAGYITGIMAYIFHLYSNSKKISRIFGLLIVFGIILSGAYLFAINYNGGDNDLNNKILRRLEFDEEKGIVGNNRTVLSNADAMYDAAWSSGEIWLGLRATDNNKTVGDLYGSSAGYKPFILINGLFVTGLYFLIYMMIGPMTAKRKKYMMGFFILICLTFVQAAYPTSYTWLIPYCLAACMQRKDYYNPLQITHKLR